MKIFIVLLESVKRGRSLLILLFISVSFILFFFELVEKSMFIDGVWYVVIFCNLVEGVGSFWFLCFLEIIFFNFYEYLFFIFGLQVVFFGVLGDYWFIECFFSFCYYLVIGLFIVCFWCKGSKFWLLLCGYWILLLFLWQVNLVIYYFQFVNLLDVSILLFGLVFIWCMWQGFYY